MRISIAAAVFALACVSGCSVSVGGDAVAACYRINAAVHASERRCSAPYPGELQDCGAVLFGDGNSSSAETCERELAARPCDDRSRLPPACQLAYVERP